MTKENILKSFIEVMKVENLDTIVSEGFSDYLTGIVSSSIDSLLTSIEGEVEKMRTEAACLYEVAGKGHLNGRQNCWFCAGNSALDTALTIIRKYKDTNHS